MDCFVASLLAMTAQERDQKQKRRAKARRLFSLDGLPGQARQ
jgi:hypothetical protein